MNRTTYRVWKQLVNNHGKWMELSGLAYQVNLTNKQTLAHVKMLPSPPVEKGYADGNRGVCFRVDTARDLFQVDVEIRAMCYGLTKEMISQVKACKDSGCFSVEEISNKTGIRPGLVSKALQILWDTSYHRGERPI